jgi:dephospho-CoA kinase
MPSQRPSRHLRTEPVVVGFTGRIGAGKTSAAMYFKSKYGFQYARYSQVLQEWLSPDNADRDRLQKLGWDIMTGGMQLELNSRLLAGLDRARSAAIDGLRHPTDFDSLSSAFGSSFRMVFLEASLERRFERLRSRFSTQAEFEIAAAQPAESYIDNLRPLASVTIRNDGSLECLHQQLDAWIAAVEMGGHK